VPLCPPQIPHGLTWDRTQVSDSSSTTTVTFEKSSGNKHLIAVFEVLTAFIIK
jgi:hypothetical protein